MVSILRAASMRSGIIRRSFSLRASRSAVRRTGVYCASFLAMGESVAGGLAPALEGSPWQAVDPSAPAAISQVHLLIKSQPLGESRDVVSAPLPRCPAAPLPTGPPTRAHPACASRPGPPPDGTLLPDSARP